MTFVWSKLLTSVLKRVVSAAVAFLTGAKVAPLLAAWGITVDPTALSVALMAALEAARGYLKHKLGVSWL